MFKKEGARYKGTFLALQVPHLCFVHTLISPFVLFAVAKVAKKAAKKKAEKKKKPAKKKAAKKKTAAKVSALSC